MLGLKLNHVGKRAMGRLIFIHLFPKIYFLYWKYSITYYTIHVDLQICICNLLKESDRWHLGFNRKSFGVKWDYWIWTITKHIFPALKQINGKSLQWRHDKRDGVSNHQPHDCILNRLFKCRSKKTSKLRATEGIPAQRASDAKKFPFDDVIMILWVLSTGNRSVISRAETCNVPIPVYRTYSIPLTY